MLIGLHKSAVEPGGGSPPPAAPGVSAPPAAGAHAGSPPAGNVISWETAPDKLRNEYQQTKQDRDEWAKLGSRDEVSRIHQTYQKQYTEANTLGTQLGYDAQELREAFDADPAGTLAFLRQTAKQAATSDKSLTQAEIDKRIEQRVKQGLKPFEQERELQLDHKAESAFDGEFDRQFKTSFPNGLPDSNREAISGLAWSLLSDNPDSYKALRGKGDTSGIHAAFEQAKKTFLKIITDYGEHEKKRIGGQEPSNGNRPPAPKKGRSFAEIAMTLNDDSIPDDVALGRR